MALLTQKNVGGVTVTPSVATKVERDIRYSTNYQTEPLATSGLPKILFWAQLYGGDGVPVPVTSGQVQFQVATRTENGEPDFFTFTYLMIPPANGISYAFDFPCIAIRLLFTPPVFGTTVRTDYSLSAYGG